MAIKDQHPQPKTEIPKPRGRKRSNNMKTGLLCIPRLRSTSCPSNNAKRLSPMTLLDRFREAVFRLIMLTALSNSKAPHNTESNDSQSHRLYNPQHDLHHSEAVADCIEFIKKSANSMDENRDPTASSSIDSTSEMIIPDLTVPAM